jgi:hypothetical protein
VSDDHNSSRWKLSQEALSFPLLQNGYGCKCRITQRSGPPQSLCRTDLVDKGASPKLAKAYPAHSKLLGTCKAKGPLPQKDISQMCHLVCTLTVVEGVLHRPKQTLWEQVRPSGDPLNCKVQIKSTCGEEANANKEGEKCTRSEMLMAAKVPRLL